MRLLTLLLLLPALAFGQLAPSKPVRTDASNHLTVYPYTLPTSVSGSGTILRSDGTNYVGSTTTWPNTATSGGVLYASGANAWATSAALGSTQVVLGGGAGAAPNTSANFTYDNVNSLLVTGPAATIITRTIPSDPGSASSAIQIGLSGVAVATPTGPSFLFFAPNSANSKSFLGRLSSIWLNATAGSETGAVTLSVRANSADTTAVTEKLRATPTGVGIGTTTITANLQLKAGTTSASTAPLKFTLSGAALMTAAEAGAEETDSTNGRYWTDSTPTRHRYTMNATNAALTSGRIPQVTTSGFLTDSSGLTVSSDILTAAGYTTPGNLTFSSTGQFITGDFSNATQTNRLLLKTSTADSTTTIGAVPNGTGTVASYNAYNNSNPTNAALAQVRVNGSTSVDLRSAVTGTGTLLPLKIIMNATDAINVDTSGNTSVAQQFIVATSASPASGDACTTGRIVWDASYVYVCTASGAWKRAALTGGY